LTAINSNRHAEPRRFETGKVYTPIIRVATSNRHAAQSPQEETGCTHGKDFQTGTRSLRPTTAKTGHAQPQTSIRGSCTRQAPLTLRRKFMKPRSEIHAGRPRLSRLEVEKRRERIYALF